MDRVELSGALTCVCGVPALLALTGQYSPDEPAGPAGLLLVAGLALACGLLIARTWAAVAAGAAAAVTSYLPWTFAAEEASGLELLGSVSGTFPVVTAGLVAGHGIHLLHQARRRRRRAGRTALWVRRGTGPAHARVPWPWPRRPQPAAHGQPSPC
ncbi:hypothetical protein [uncultured Pseudokineococcus sp.]|uniref:hypothetical protein n=1 Tax=uncultured Pseudokineococcus sp. TaxID=1642928 RepID=UPI002605F094|nr:hypothetical protein [uncultured Pseudokineococcus sp.]